MGAASPRSGPPPRFESYEDYAEMVSLLEASGAIDDYTQLWWDVRPHPRLGTLELRVPDAQFDLDRRSAIAAYVQSLVAELIDEIEHGNGRSPTTGCWSPRTRGPQAATASTRPARPHRGPPREGGRPELVGAGWTSSVPTPASSAALDALGGIDRILLGGTGAARQLRAWRAHQDLHAMLSDLCDVTELAARPLAPRAPAVEATSREAPAGC